MGLPHERKLHSSDFRQVANLQTTIEFFEYMLTGLVLPRIEVIV